jgi:hypothetical protein
MNDTERRLAGIRHRLLHEQLLDPDEVLKDAKWLLARVETLERAEKWQRMDTAPKDGRTVLLMGGENTGRWICTGYWARVTRRWSVDTVAPLPSPTHWAPLPSDGSALDEKGGR